MHSGMRHWHWVPTTVLNSECSKGNRDGAGLTQASELNASLTLSCPCRRGCNLCLFPPPPKPFIIFLPVWQLRLPVAMHAVGEAREAREEIPRRKRGIKSTLAARVVGRFCHCGPRPSHPLPHPHSPSTPDPHQNSCADLAPCTKGRCRRKRRERI